MTNNNTTHSKVNNSVCEALGCYENATEKIDVNVGKFGIISLSICTNCVGKFVTQN